LKRARSSGPSAVPGSPAPTTSVIAVGDQQPRRRLVDGDLAGVGEHAAGRQRRAPQPEWARVERAPRARLLDHLAHDLVEHVAVALAGDAAHHVALGVDHHQRRPRADRVGVPDGEAAVVHHRVLDLVAADRLADVAGLSLVGELRGMDADDDERVAVLALETLEIGQDVHAVDAAVGPEVEDDDLAVQLGERQRPVGVQPALTARQLGSAHARLG